MALQQACFISTVEQTADGWQPTFAGNLQAGESFSGSIAFAPDGTPLTKAKDFEPGADDLVTAAGLTVVYVTADETRITLGAGLSQYHLVWKQYVRTDAEDFTFDAGMNPGDNMTGAELSAILTYLAANTPYSAATITQWIINKFGVSTQQQAVAWATSRPRYATVAKLMQAFRIWADAKGELDALP